jgi:phenylacetate-CoA ligase
VSSRTALTRLPVTRKTELLERQKTSRATDPFGGFSALRRAPPDLRTRGRHAFSYHMTSGTFILKYGAHAVGCTVFPAGTGQTEQQLQAIAGLKPEAYTGTPSFLRILVEKAQANGVDIGSLRKAAVGGEALPPSLRD